MMKPRAVPTGLSCLAAWLALCLACPSAQALIMVIPGNQRVENYGWPLGAEKVANLPSRLGAWEGPPFGGGEWHFLYRSKDTAEFNEALALFAAIRTPRLELVIHDALGPEPSHTPKSKVELGADWTFTVWRPENWHRLYSNPESSYDCGNPNFRKPVAPPRIDVYLGGGAIVWLGVKVPEKVRVIDRRAEAAPAKLDGGGLIRGGVYDMATGQAVAGAEVTLLRSKDHREWEEARRVQADALGSFEIAKIPYGWFYEATIRAKGYASRKQTYRLDENVWEESVIELARDASLQGIVTDTARKPLPGVQVSLVHVLGIDGRGYSCPDVRPTTTSAEGRFEFRSLPRGYAELWAEAASLWPAASTQGLYRIPSDRIKIVMTEAGSIRGNVVGKEAGPPERAASVYLEAMGPWRFGTWGGFEECSPDARFEFKSVPPGEYILSTKRILPDQPLDPNAKVIVVKAKETVEVTIER